MTKSKSFCSLILKEQRDILDTASFSNYFFFACLLDTRKFLNRLALILQKKGEINTKQSFAKFSTYFDKLITEEFFRNDQVGNDKIFHDVRIKKSFGMIKPKQSQQSEEGASN